MAAPFDADDFMKRGIFSSIMGFKRNKTRNDGPSQSLRPPISIPPLASVCHAPTSTSMCAPVLTHAPMHAPMQQQTVHLTPNDIFREIVCECENLERSNNTTPFSDFPSCPASPMMPPPLHPQPFEMQQHYHSNPAPYDPSMIYAPPPYTPMPHMFMQHPQQILIHPHADNPEIKNSVLLEDVVKMVVSAMRQSSLQDGQNMESPEDILRRKRQQNNDAAARYRKRQREARERAEGELEDLSRKNDNLRNTIMRMEMEIQTLKDTVMAKPINQ